MINIIYVILVEDRGLYGRYYNGSHIHDAYETYEDAYNAVQSMYPNIVSIHRGSLDPEKDSPYFEAFDSKNYHKYHIRIIETRLWH